MCVKCMGMLARLRIGVSNYRGGNKAERILDIFYRFSVRGMVV